VQHTKALFDSLHRVDLCGALAYLVDLLFLLFVMKSHLLRTAAALLLLTLLCQCAGVIDEYQIRRDSNTLINPDNWELEALEANNPGYTESETQRFTAPAEENIIAYPEPLAATVPVRSRSTQPQRMPKRELSATEQLAQFDTAVKKSNPNQQQSPQQIVVAKKPAIKNTPRPQIQKPPKPSAITKNKVSPSPMDNQKKPLLQKVWHRLHNQPEARLPTKTTRYDPKLIEELRR